MTSPRAFLRRLLPSSARAGLLHAALAIALTGLSTSALRAINVTEPPDFPNSSANVTSAFTYTLSSGTNTFSGSVTTPNDGQDNFAVVVPAGQQILSVTVNITANTSGQAFSGGSNFNTLNVTGTGPQTFAIGNAPLGAGTYPANVYTDFAVGNAWTMTITTGPVPDYSIITQNGTMTVTNNSNNGDMLTVSEPSSGNIKFAASNRTFRFNTGALTSATAGSSGTVTLSGANPVQINGGSGNETINVNAFTNAAMSGISITCGAGVNAVNFTGNITFASNASLYVDATASSAGTVSVTAAQLTAKGTGTITLLGSKNVALTGGAVVQTTGGGSIDVEANQQGTATTGNFVGVKVDGTGTKLQSTVGSGTVTVLGCGGNDAGGSQGGVVVSNGAQILGNSTVTVTGTGGTSTGSANRGVTVSGANSLIDSPGSSSVTVTGTAGTQGSASGTGVSVLSGGQIGQYSGTVTVTGTGGGATSSSANQGVEIGGVATPASNVATGALNATITGTPGPGASTGLYLSNAAVLGNNNTSSMIVHTDSLLLDSTSSITTNGGLYSLKLFTIAATHIDLGGANGAGTLGLSAAELSQIKAPYFLIQGIAGGDITISQPITFSVRTNLYLNPGTGGTRASASGTDLNLDGGSLTLGGPLNVPIAGPTADTNFPQLGVVGGITFNGASLNLAGTTYAGTLGQTFTILKNGGGSAVNGTFQNLPEGASLPWPGPSATPFNARISYKGGAGNDVTLTLVSAFVVTTAVDSVGGSLRNVLAFSATHAGPDTITFDPSLNGATIPVTGTSGGYAITVNDSAGVTVDATGLANGLTIQGGGASGNYGLFSVPGGSTCMLRGLTLVQGAGNSGGAILNNGATTVVRCTFSGNASLNYGGAIYSTGSGALTALECTFTGGSSGFGGAICAAGGTVTLGQCTVANNTATTAGGGLAIVSATLNCANSIVAGNTNTFAPDIYLSNGTINRAGANVVGSNPYADTAFPAGLPNANGDYVGSAGSPLNAMLAPLGSYGGPEQTMPPLPGSPAIDHGVTQSIPVDPTTNMPFTADQRGFPSPSGSAVDIGAVETSALQVTTLAGDSSAGSLRAQVAAATDITTTLAFAPGLGGGTIPFASEIVLNKNVAFDASALSTGLTLSGNNASRLFYVNSAQTVALIGVTLSGGNGVGTSPSGSGGAIYNAGGTVTLTQCLLTGNAATLSSAVGGAIRQSTGTLTLNRCTVSNNTSSGTSSTAGGIGIGTGSTVTLNQCTVAGNTAASSGGALKNNAGATLTLNQCTVANNTSGTLGGGLNNLGTATLNNSIVATNNATTGADINNDSAATLTKSGANIVLSSSGPAATGSGSIIVGYPLLAPLDYYGGPTPTMATEPSSPARNAATGSTVTSDQRGFPIVGTPDIGAYEAGTLAPNYNAYIWESLPVGSSVAQHAASADYDGDGVSNYNEWLAQTSPTDPTSYLQLTQVSLAGSNFTFTFQTVAGRHYVVQTSSDLITWVPASGSIGGFGGPLTDTVQASGTRFFVRVSVGP